MTDDFRELEAGLRMTADGDCREMRRDRLVIPDIVDEVDLTKWADLMDDAANAIAILRRERDVGRDALSEWRPISTAPMNEMVLTFSKALGRVPIGVRYQARGLVNWWSPGSLSGVVCTHWMPLPKPPEGA